MDLVFRKRSALVPEFAKIVCVSMAFVLDSGETKNKLFQETTNINYLWMLELFWIDVIS